MLRQASASSPPSRCRHHTEGAADGNCLAARAIRRSTWAKRLRKGMQPAPKAEQRPERFREEAMTNPKQPGVGRRNFLKSVGVAGAASAVAPLASLPAQAQVPPHAEH